MKRNYKFDNIKLILILFVIVAHFFELFKGEERAYLTIYTFHMPLFIFLTGIFAKFDKKRLITYIFTYVVFQILYKIFDFYVLGNGKQLSITFMTPYWLLWYMLVIIFYTFLIPLIDTKNNIIKLVIITISIALSLITPYFKDIGYSLSLARFFTFMPYFVCGFYFKDYIEKVEDKLKNKKLYIPLLCGFITLAIGVCIYMFKDTTITQNMLYGSYSYASAKYNIGYKALFMLFAIIFIGVFYLLIPNIKIPFVSIIGANTMTIFLFHGFIVRYLKFIKFFKYDLTENILISMALALLISVILGNKYISKALNFVFTGKFIFVIIDKIKEKKKVS